MIDINEKIKHAMKNKLIVELGVYRSLKASIEVFQKESGKKTIDEEDFRKIIKSQIKKRNQSIEKYNEASRPDLALIETAELHIINQFAPKILNNSELETLIDDFIKHSKPNNMGEVMTHLKKLSTTLTIDMKHASTYAKERLV